MLSTAYAYGPPTYARTGLSGDEPTTSTAYRGYLIATHTLPGESSYSFSLFNAVPSGRVASLMTRSGFDTRREALAAAKTAVDLALYPGVSGVGGFSFSSISKALTKLGKGVARNAGTIGAVTGGIVGSVVPGAGTAAGAAIGAAAGGALQAGRESRDAEKAADAEKDEAKKQAKKAEKAAAADVAASTAAARAAESTPAPKRPLWPWLAGGGAVVIVGGVALWLLLRRKTNT